MPRASENQKLAFHAAGIEWKKKNSLATGADMLDEATRLTQHLDHFNAFPLIHCFYDGATGIQFWSREG